MSLGDGEAKIVANQVAQTTSSLDPTTICPVYSETGKCRHGFKCRFLGAHVKAEGDDFSDELSLIVDGDKAAHAAVSTAELNFVDSDVRKQLRTRKVIAFHPPRGHSSADSLYCGTTRPPSYTCTVSEARFGRLLERNSTVTGRRIPGTAGSDRGCPNTVIWCRS